jgi:hypothetical protein
VTVRLIHWRGALPRAVLLAVAVALIPIPAMAGDTKPAPKAATIEASMKQIVAREVAKAPVTRVVTRRSEQASSAKESGGFFRTGPGMVALGVLAVGAGYAIYSASHDRIHSPAKK